MLKKVVVPLQCYILKESSRFGEDQNQSPKFQKTLPGCFEASRLDLNRTNLKYSHEKKKQGKEIRHLSCLLENGAPDRQRPHFAAGLGSTLR
jgi:hypothetical protein